MSPDVLALIFSSCINEDCMYVRTSKATYKELEHISKFAKGNQINKALVL